MQTGKENVLQAVHALGQPQLDAGYILTCQSFAKGPGIVVTLDQYDEVYESQYGQFEKSYGELKYTNGNEPVQEEKKKKGLFGF